MTSSRFSKALGVTAALALIVTFAGQIGLADTFTWSGASSNSWNDSGNWRSVITQGNGVPGGLDLTWFSAVSYTRNTVNTSGSQVTLGLWDTGSAAVTVGGSGLTISGTTDINGFTNAGIDMESSAGALTINAPITLGRPQNWYNNSVNLLTLGGANNNNSYPLNISGSGTTLFAGGLAGVGGLAVSSGSVIVQGTGMTYTGVTNINGGTLQLGNFGVSGSLSKTSAIVDNGTLAFAFARSGDVTQGIDFTNIPITGAGNLVQMGLSKLVLNQANTYSGTNVITGGGTISVSADNNLGLSGTAASSFVYLNGGQLTTTNTGNLTNTHVFTVGPSGGTINVAGIGVGGTGQYIFSNSSTLAGSGALTVTGTGVLSSTGAGNLRVNSVQGYSGPITLRDGGILEYGVSGAFPASATFTIGNQGELETNGGITLPNNITVAGGNNSTLSFNGGGTFSGSIALTANATVAMRNWWGYGTASNGTISGPISGSGGLAVTPGTGAAVGGILTLTNSANTFSGGVTVTSTVLEIGADGMLGAVPSSPTANISLVNGALKNNGPLLEINANRTITISGTGAFRPGSNSNVPDIQVDGQITGNGDLDVLWDVGILTLNGSNSYTGNTVIGSAVLPNYNGSPGLRLGSATALPLTTNVIFGAYSGGTNTATLDLYGQSPTIGGLSGGTNGRVNNSLASSSSTLTVGNSNASGSFLGVLRNSGTGGATLTLVKTGTGLQVLGGADTYTGGTVVTAGTLQTNSPTALGTGNNVFQISGGVLDLFGNNVTVGQFRGAGSQVTSSVGAGVLTINNAGSTVFSGVLADGAAGTAGLTLNAGTLTLLGANTATGATVVSPNALLQVGSGGALGGAAGTPLTVNGTLALGDSNGLSGSVVVASLGGTGSIVGGSALGNAGIGIKYVGASVNSFLGTIGGPGTNQNNIALTIAGAGMLRLVGNSTYTGSTTISTGTLNVTGQLANSSVTLASDSGATLMGTGIIGGNVTAGSNSIISLNAGVNSAALTINGNLALGKTTGTYVGSSYTTLTYVPGAGIEPIHAGSVTFNPGGAYVNIPQVGNSYPSVGTYTLLTYTSSSGGGSVKLTTGGLGAGTFVGAAGNTSVGYRLGYTLSRSSTSLVLTVTGNATPGVAFFDHQSSYSWDDVSQQRLNWSIDAAGGTLAGMLPGPATDIVLSSTGAGVLPTTLGGPTTINSLNTNVNNSAGFTINGDAGSTLTIVGAGDTNHSADNTYLGNPNGAGISLSTGSLGINNVPVMLAASQVWTNGSSGLLAVTGTGTIAGTALQGSTQTLTLSNTGSGGTKISAAITDGLNGGILALAVSGLGTGATTVAGANTFSGGTTLSGGSLVIGNVNALGAGGTTISGGTMDLSGFNINLPVLNGTGGVVTNNGFSASTLTVQSGNYSGTINGSTFLSLVKSGSGVFALTGNNGYAGGTTISSGVLQVSGSGSLGPVTSSLTFSGGTLQALNGLSSARSYLISSNANASVDTNGSSMILSGTIAPVGGATNAGLYKVGQGTLTIAANSSLNGAATIDGGALNLTGLLNSTAAVNVSNSLDSALNLSGTLSTSSDLIVGAGSTGVGTLTGSGVITANNLTLGNSTSGHGVATISGNATVTNGMTLGAGDGAQGSLASSGSATITNAITLGGGAGAQGYLTNSGIMNLTSTASNLVVASGSAAVGLLTNSGTLTANNNASVGSGVGSSGTLTNSGIMTLTATSSNLSLGAGSASVGVLKTSGTLTAVSLRAGAAVGAVGAAYQTGGNINMTATGGPGYLLGYLRGGYGYYNLKNGSLSGYELHIGSWGPDYYSGGNGLLDMSGGTLATTNYFILNRSQGTGSQIGVLNLTGSGLMNLGGQGLQANWGQAGTAVVNVSGGTILSSGPINLNQTGGTGNLAIFNLKGGFVQSSGVTGGTNGTIVNLNGGTLQSVANGNSLNVAAAYVYPAGITMDDGGNLVTATAPILAPTGNGVTSAGLTVSGSGYAAPPIVTIADAGSTGSGATAYATIDSNGNLTGVVVSNPGVNYTSPTFSLTGGGGTGSISGSAVLAANLSTGGLTKVGGGRLTLSSSNTYGGRTIVNAGILRASQPAALPSYNLSGSVSVAAGATLMLESDSGAGWSVVSGGDIDTALSHVAFSASSSLGISVTGASPVSYAGNIGTGQINKGFVKDGAGELILNGATNSYIGATTVSAGTLQFGDGVLGALPSGTTSYVDNATLAFSLPSNASLTIPVTGSGILAQAGSSRLTLSVSNTYTGATLGLAGTMQLGVDNAIPTTTAATFNGGMLDLNRHAQTVSQFIVNNSALSQSNGTLTVAGGMDGALQIGGAAGTSGSYTMTGGTLNTTPGGNFDVGWNGNGTFIQSGGTATGSSYVIIGRFGGATGVYSISGGVLQQTGTGQRLIVGEQGTGTLNISGSGLVTSANGVQVGFGAGPGVGTLNLNGGTLTCLSVLGTTNTASTSTVNFNGGLLQASATPNSTFLANLTHANVQAGGALIDTNSSTITITQALVHGGTAAVDGGLKKIGAGTLIVGGVDMYTGPTVVNAGTLQLQAVANPSIGIKFSSAGNSLVYSVTGTAGFVPISGWNNVTGQNGTGVALVNPTGGTLVPAVSWNSSGLSSSFTASQTDQDAQLMNALINTTGSLNTVVSVSSIPFSKYDLYVYFGSRSNDSTGSVLVGSTSYNYTTDSAITSSPYSYQQATSSDANSFPYANYAEFSRMSSGSVAINLIRGSGDSGITAVEIVGPPRGPLPSTTVVSVAAGATLDLGAVSQTVGALSDVSSGTGGIITNGGTAAATLTLATPANSSTTFSGSIQDGNLGYSSGMPIALVVGGSGTQVLTGSSAYSGGTYVKDSGTLIVTKSTVIPDNSNLFVGSGIGSFGDTLPDSSVPPLVEGISPQSNARTLNAVPEPGTLVLLIAVLGSAAACRRVRRRRASCN